MPAAKAKKPAAKSPQPTKPSSDNALAIVSMVLGVTSLTGPGLIFGIPAIVLATIALKNNQGEKGLSITGLVTGIISTVLSVIVIGVLIFLFSWGATMPDPAPVDELPVHMHHHI